MLDSKGFKRKTYDELLTDMSNKAKELFGANANVSERAVLGIFIRIFAWFLSIIWQVVEKVYNNSFPGSAEGISLDRAVTFKGVTRLEADYARGKLKITGAPGQIVEAPFVVGTSRDILFETIEDATLDVTGIAIVDIYAQEPGIQGNVEIGEVTEILNPNPEVVYSVTNEEATFGGRNRETDAELYERYSETPSNIKSSSTNSIQAALLEVDGVRDARVSENTSMVEVNGIPPKAIAPFVFGGSDADVAATIFEVKAGGIQSYGSTIITVSDSENNSHEIGFTRPEEIGIYVRVTLTKKSTFPTDGEATIQTQIIDYIGGFDVSGIEHYGLGLDEDVIHAKIVAKAFSIDSVEDALVELSLDGITYSQGNIAVASNQVAKTTVEKVVVS